MQRLSDFKPLQQVALPGLGLLDCSGLILIVGPNSSGKTQLLRDLYFRVSGQPRDLVVAEKIELRKPAQLKPFLDCLEREGYLTRFVDQSGNEHLRPLTTFVGTGEAVGQQITARQPGEWLESFTPADLAKARTPNAFLSYFGRFLVTALFLEKRLISVNSSTVFDHVTQPPQTDLQAFWVEEAAKSELLAEVRASFSKTVWPDATRGNILALKVSDDAESPSAEERLAPKLMEKYRTIEAEGDGLKSYVATCVALLLGRRPVCLVDEPELCLHPPQAYSLGKFIGRFGASSDRATFVATHSSHVLRGVIQTSQELQIVRLIRRGQSFEAHLVPSDVLRQILAKPTVRAETVLDGIFSQAVVIVEADGDRTVYHAVFDTLSNEFHLDVHLTAVGGTGGIADTCRLYRTLKIPLAVIADLDLITDSDRLEKIVSALGSGVDTEPLKSAASAVSSAIRSLPPTVGTDDVKRELAELAALGMDWSRNDDIPLREALQALAQDLDRMRRLKRGGIDSLPSAIATRTRFLVDELSKIGIFVVPVGELEEWLGTNGVTASKHNKWAWANEAAAMIRKAGPRDGDVWDFVRSVATFLNRALTAVAGG